MIVAGTPSRRVEVQAQRPAGPAARARPSRARPRPPPASARSARRSGRRGTSCRVLVVDAPAHEHDLVDRRARPRTRRASCSNDDQLDRALEVVERREHHRGRRSCVRIFLASVMMPPTVTQSPSLRCGELGERAVDACAQRLAHLLERVRGDEQADRLLLDGEQLALVELLGRDRRVRRAGTPWPAARRRRRGRPCRRSSPGRSARPAATSGRRPAPARAPSSMPLRVAPVEPNAPHLISASIAFLLTGAASTRSQKSHSESNGPSFSRARLDRLDGREADALHGVEPEADVALDDDELVVGQVDVRRQDLDAHLLAAGDEERDLVLGVHHRGDQRGHVLGRVVGLQPGRAVGDQRVTGGVRLVERVVGGLLVRLPEPVDRRCGSVPDARQPSRNSGFELGHRLAVLLADRLAQVVGLRRREKPASSLAICIACSW